MYPIYNHVIVKAYDQDGNELPDQHTIVHNTVWGEVFPEETIITIQFDRLPIGPEGEKVIAKPVTVDGVDYHGHWIWGSGVKMGRSLGVTRDLLVDHGLIRFAEDVYRAKRAVLPNGLAAGRGELKVKLLPVGTVAGSYKIEDGFGYIKQSLAENIQGKREKLAKVHYGDWDTSYTYLQRYEFTPEFWEELRPHVEAALVAINDPAAFAFSHLMDAGAKSEFMKLAWELDEKTTYDALSEHPYLASSFVESWARAAFRVAISGGVGMKGGLFVPTVSDKLVLPLDRFEASDKYIITRYPVDSPSSIRLVETLQDGPEAQRIASMEAVQYTLTTATLNNSFKGMLGIIPDEQWPFDPTYDVVTSTEDEKLNVSWLTEDDINQAKETERGYIFSDAILVFTQWYAAGCAIGVPSSLAKKLGGDYDGDSGAVEAATKFPERARQAALFPDIPNPKLPKIKTPIKTGQSRAGTLLKSMANIVGQATNVYSTVLSYSDQEFLARELGYQDANTLHRLLERAIKVGTDIFKTSEDYRPVERMLSTVGKGLRQLGVHAPWTAWNGDEIAFHNNVPPVYEDVVNQDEWTLRMGIGPQTTGTIAEIARRTLPYIQVLAQTPIRPLSFYQDWAVQPNNRYLKPALELQMRYARRVGAVNMQSNDGFANFVNLWQALVDQTVSKEKLDRYQLAQALWWVFHTDQRHSQLKKLASGPFLAMPAEIKQLITEKPGRKLSTSGIPTLYVVGLKYQWPAADFHQNEPIPVKVEDFVQGKGNDQIVRQILVARGPINNLKPAKDPQYPEGYLALTALNMSYVEPGDYVAYFALVDKNWEVSLER